MPSLQNPQTLLVEIAIEAGERRMTPENTIMCLDGMLRGHRRGIASTIVEMILVIASLVSSVALSGFLFGTLGFFSRPAEVAATGTSRSST
jgi:hypothetical protein